MVKWQNIYEKYVVRFLVKEPLKHGSYFLSHGFFHLIMCVLVFYVTYEWTRHNVTSSDTTMHNLYVNVKPPYKASTLKDTLTTLLINFELDSDTVLKQSKRKYNSRISLTYHYDYSCRDSEFINTPKDTTTIKFYSKPFLDDLIVEQDSISNIPTTEKIETPSGTTFKQKQIPYVFETHCTTKQLEDSVVEISVLPAKNIKNMSGGEDGEGSQTILIGSNNLGLSKNDSYYNYYINFGFLPPIKETNNYSGLVISFQFGDMANNKGLFNVGNKSLLYQYIYPQPDIITNGFLLYHSDEAISNVVKNHGIIIQAIDIDALNNNNRRAIISSVLVGTGAALFFDILIQLIRELKNLNRRKEEEEAERQKREHDTIS